eukprot:3724192-Prymnesium_polylepis.2
MSSLRGGARRRIRLRRLVAGGGRPAVRRRRGVDKCVCSIRDRQELARRRAGRGRVVRRGLRLVVLVAWRGRRRQAVRTPRRPRGGGQRCRKLLDDALVSGPELNAAATAAHVQVTALDPRQRPLVELEVLRVVVGVGGADPHEPAAIGVRRAVDEDLAPVPRLEPLGALEQRRREDDPVVVRKLLDRPRHAHARRRSNPGDAGALFR